MPPKKVPEPEPTALYVQTQQRHTMGQLVFQGVVYAILTAAITLGLATAFSSSARTQAQATNSNSRKALDGITRLEQKQSHDERVNRCLFLHNADSAPHPARVLHLCERHANSVPHGKRQRTAPGAQPAPANSSTPNSAEGPVVVLGPGSHQGHSPKPQPSHSPSPKPSPSPSPLVCVAGHCIGP